MAIGTKGVRIGLAVVLGAVCLAAITTSGLFFDVVPARSRIMNRKPKVDPRFELARETDFGTSSTATTARSQ